MSGRVALAVGLVVLGGAAALWFSGGAPTPSPAPPAAAPAPAAPPPAVALPPVPPPAPAAAGAVLVGRVLTADDAKPVAGARVEADGCEGSATTGPDGAFRLEGIPPGTRTVVAFPAEHAQAAADVEFAEGTESARDLFVAAGCVVEGRVLAEGKPVAGAVVSNAQGTKRSTTADDGAWRLRGFRPGTDALFVEAEGFEEHPVDIDVPPGASLYRVDVELRKAWTVRGVVLDGEKPVEGARVVPALSHLDSDRSGNGPSTAHSVAVGTFVLSGVEVPEEKHLFAWKEGLGYGVSDSIEIAEGATLDAVAVRIAPSVEAVITVVDGAGRPVEGPIVSVRRLSLGLANESAYPFYPRLPEIPLTTDREGRCRARVQLGEWEFIAARDGSFAASKRVHVLRANGDLAIPLVLRDGGDLAGIVLDAEGAPVAGARVWAMSSRENPTPDVESDDNGSFRLRGRPDAEHRLRVEKEGFVATTLEGVRPGRDPVIVKLPRGSRVRGTVVLADGKTPARACTVRLFFEATEDGKAWAGGSWPFRELDVSDAEGRFEFADVEAGTISAEAESGDLLSPRARGIRTEAGKDPPDVRLVLQRGAAIRGTVRDAKGKPLPGARLDIEFAPPQGEEDEDCAGTERYAIADEQGRYELRVVPAGRYRLHIDETGFFEHHRPVAVAEGSDVAADIVLESGGGLAVECVDADGKRVEEFELVVEDEKGERIAVPYLAGGYSYRPVFVASEMLAGGARFLAGNYRGRIESEGFAPAPVRFVIREGETTTVKVALKKAP